MEGKDLLCPITRAGDVQNGYPCQKDRCAWYEPELKTKELEEHAVEVLREI